MQTIRQTIINDEKLKAISGGYLSILDDIHKARTDIYTAEKVLADYKVNGIRANRERAETIECEIAFDIQRAVDDDNKPKYKNEGQRKAAISEELKRCGSYQQTRSDLLKSEQQENELVQRVQKHKCDLEFFRNQFYVWQSQMALASSLGHEQQEHRFVTVAEISIGGPHVS